MQVLFCKGKAWYTESGKSEFVEEHEWNGLKPLNKCFAIFRNKLPMRKNRCKKLKAAGKEKSATYRQFFGNRFFYKQMLDTYKKYGLIE